MDPFLNSSNDLFVEKIINAKLVTKKGTSMFNYQNKLIKVKKAIGKTTDLGSSTIKLNDQNILIYLPGKCDCPNKDHTEHCKKLHTGGCDPFCIDVIHSSKCKLIVYQQTLQNMLKTKLEEKKQKIPEIMYSEIKQPVDLENSDKTWIPQATEFKEEEEQIEKNEKSEEITKKKEKKKKKIFKHLGRKRLSEPQVTL